MKIKKYLYFGALALSVSLSSVGVKEVSAEAYTKTFIISAYYSPLPCQERYVTGSLAGDKRLNGNGTNGADGTPVYAGMIAAPKTYAFGTKMHIPGLGVAAVHDRGGAIVSADTGKVAYDRLDVWMGYGDAGLKRALNWGKRTVEVTVYGVDGSIKEDLHIQGYSSEEAIPRNCEVGVESGDGGGFGSGAEKKDVVVKPPAAPKNDTVSEDAKDFFSKDLKAGDVNEDVRKLQNELRRLNYLRVDSTAVYGELTEHAVFKFQQAQGIIEERSDQGAGVFGPKTRAKLNEILENRNRINKLVERQEKIEQELGTGGPEKDSKYAFVPFLRELDPGVVGEDVRNLQLLLQEEGFFDNPFVSNFYGEKTREAVIKFQIANGIIKAVTDLGAGRVGPSTLLKLNDLLNK